MIFGVVNELKDIGNKKLVCLIQRTHKIIYQLYYRFVIA
jgi:hypothetical protein